MVFSKPEGVGCSVPSAARALLHARGFTKYHISRWTQSLAGLGYGQYTDMFTCISTYTRPSFDLPTPAQLKRARTLRGRPGTEAITS